MTRYLFVWVGTALLGCGAPPPAEPGPASEETESDTETPVGDIEAEPAAGESARRTVYVPAYSHLDRGGRSTLFAVTLSVRNVDPSAEVRLTAVDYYDTSGHRVRRYLRAPRRLAPLETAEFSVETLDEVGGSGANFLVYWDGPSNAHPLLTETVMIGQVSSGSVAFTSRGVELERPLALEPGPAPAAAAAEPAAE